MPDDFEKDPLVYSDKVKRQMEEDPALAEAMRRVAAEMRQAHHAWRSGQYASFGDAMKAITGKRPEPVEIDDEDYEAAEKTLAEMKEKT
jgi:predicted TPR repeat methyltransferase